MCVHVRACAFWFTWVGGCVGVCVNVCGDAGGKLQFVLCFVFSRAPLGRKLVENFE